MMRLDKFLASQGIGTRSEVKNYIKKGWISINGSVCKNSDYKIEETQDSILFKDNIISYRKFIYYMLNKPAGVITATEDNKSKTVLDLLENVFTKNLFPVGRLDKDTEGLLIITNDGELSHFLLSPKYHVDKTYYLKIEKPITSDKIDLLKRGIDIGEKNLTLPAKVIQLNSMELKLTIQEGKFHQVKRMLEAVDNKVIYLRRDEFAGISLDPSLKLGEYRELTATEIERLKKNVK